MIFIDGIVLSQKYPSDMNVREIAGVRSIAFREVGDIGRQGEVIEKQEVIGEQLRYAWIQGSHNTSIRIKSDDGLVSLAGNPGRWSRPDNLFSYGLDGTINASNSINYLQGLPPFEAGEPISTTRYSRQLLPQGMTWATGGNEIDAYVIPTETGYREGARVWTIHVTQNYATGSPENAMAVLNWLDSQSMARVKKSRLGKSTVIWGSLRYCQTEAYIKSDEMLAHCKSELEREMIKQSQSYKFAHENGIVRIEIKAAKDYLRDRGMTWLGALTMENITKLFNDRTEILHRVKPDVEEFDVHQLPTKVAVTAAAWLRGEDVSTLLPRATLYRHAKVLREYGLDILQKRNLATFPVRVRTIDLKPCSIPDWYSLEQDFSHLKVAA